MVHKVTIEIFIGRKREGGIEREKKREREREKKRERKGEREGGEKRR